MGHYAAEMCYPEWEPTEEDRKRWREKEAEKHARWTKAMDDHFARLRTEQESRMREEKKTDAR